MDYLTRPPAKAQLKYDFLDSNRLTCPQDMLNCAARMILELDAPQEVAQIGLEFLLEKLKASRADLGFMKRDDKVYNPSSIAYNDAVDPPRCDGMTYPAEARVFRRTWYNDRPVACDNVSEDPLLADSRDAFLGIQSKSIAFRRLTLGGKGVGLMCLDYTDHHHVWTASDLEFVDLFTDRFLAPLAAISRHWNTPADPVSARRPTPAELAAIRLAADGLTYKHIAAQLGKSERTIENQLRNAKNTLGVSTLRELIKRCELWI